MKVTTLKSFFDRIERISRNKGDVFEVSKERFEEINNTKNGLMVEVVTEETIKPKKKNAKKG